jgi:hypothetical protein
MAFAFEQISGLTPWQTRPGSRKPGMVSTVRRAIAKLSCRVMTALAEPPAGQRELPPEWFKFPPY